MRKVLLIAFAVVAAVVVLPIATTVAVNTVPALFEGGECSEREIRLSRDIPQYGGRRLEPEYNSQGCFIAFTTEDSSETVRSYYREQLTAHGWTPESSPPPMPGQEPGALDANRDRYGYEILTESTREGTSVVVYFIER